MNFPGNVCSFFLADTLQLCCKFMQLTVGRFYFRFRLFSLRNVLGETSNADYPLVLVKHRIKGHLKTGTFGDWAVFGVKFNSKSFSAQRPVVDTPPFLFEVYSLIRENNYLA